ncbi:MAG: class III poly(R)-hydroxyalkanoic acid synthase subunit PhaC [Saprospiraceae bacterium]|nr:class III poly(R)-hydroxyalkanoic acid synthase subunit PhaC [Candidatus Vicinibacter affinis]MBP6171959.1 class III poly(R)-hydroxyalkanoic acid synthase subunit PhaC [Saprospiraceae bacterium]MBK6822412.1 class III poly(R)-hydroxyalkanoic acid synthase subunit PhaC [Candidatus Vicinibacter affinis]MBK7692946.1 class III poly(R)-hydroxyalkanoic acid synthase subunit PhaC [Candidatus Vicinibacter affinis]MBK7797750.1 class III poly(R)-hydroxyalkanoic acid synthase subunit PhaC [Candidatus Vi
MINTNSVFGEFLEIGEKLKKGYETLKSIDSVEVATTPKELVWSCDKVQMFHYIRETPAKCKTPVLVSFAIMNRHDVLDLQPDRSLMKKLLDEGLDIYIMDWGYPSKADRFLSMEDYILGYMDDAIDFIRNAHKIDKIHKMGICQGGLFSMIYASIFPEKLKSLTTYVAPYDFKNANCNMLFKWTKYVDVDTMVNTQGIISADMLNNAFSMLKPSMDIAKFFGVLEMMDDRDKLMNFLRMEKWKNDCPDLSGEMYRKYIKDLFRDNKLVNGEFELDGKIVDLKNMTVPFLNVYATEDNIIPNESTVSVMDKIGSKDKQLYAFPGGHIGVFVGAKSQKELAPSVAKWVIERC